MSHPLEPVQKEPLAKRQRLEVAEDVTRSDIWYDDGSVILQAETTQFRVHWGVLSEHSTFFRDMRGLPQPPDQPSIEGCPIVELYDSFTDVKHLLDALYHPPLFSEDSLPFPFISAIIRLARKYEFKSFFAAAVKRLTCENPTTLDQYEPSTRIAEGELNYVATQIERHENILFDTITLARENNLFAILPCAYLRVILFYDQETILDGIPQDDGPPLKLSSQDQRLCRLGSQKIFQAQWEQPQFWGWFTLDGCAEGCTDKVGCAAWKNIVFRELVKKQASLAPFQLGSDPRLCSVCAVKHAEILVEVRKKLWDDLPSFFDLPPWAELKNDL